jgi:hypothetical protein
VLAEQLARLRAISLFQRIVRVHADDLHCLRLGGHSYGACEVSFYADGDGRGLCHDGFVHPFPHSSADPGQILSGWGEPLFSGRARPDGSGPAAFMVRALHQSVQRGLSESAGVLHRPAS